MAIARMTQQWADGSATQVEVEAEGQHPDLLDELVTRVARLWDVALAEADAEVDDGSD